MLERLLPRSWRASHSRFRAIRRAGHRALWGEARETAGFLRPRTAKELLQKANLLPLWRGLRQVCALPTPSPAAKAAMEGASRTLAAAAAILAVLSVWGIFAGAWRAIVLYAVLLLPISGTALFFRWAARR